MSYFGIDLGTTTTLISKGLYDVASDRYYAETLSIPQFGKWKDMVMHDLYYLPSLAFFPDETCIYGAKGEQPKCVGEEAKQKMLAQPENSIRAVKRLMGRSIPPFSFNRKTYTPSDISALYIDSVLRRAVIERNDRIDGLTVTVPASFTTRQRKDTLRAVQSALNGLGLTLQNQQNSNLLISEPIAALVSFLTSDINEHIHQVDIEASPRILVYDIGGGTLDLTMVKIGWKNTKRADFRDLDFRIEDIFRYTQIGGEDFDDAIARHIWNAVLDQNPRLGNRVLESHQRKAVRHELMEIAERVKRSFNDEYREEKGRVDYRETISIQSIGEPIEAEIHLSQATMRQILAPLLSDPDSPRNCVKPITDFMKRCNLSLKDIQYMYLVGGMSRFEILYDDIARIMDGPILLSNFDRAMTAVSQGAAIYNALCNMEAYGIREPASDAYYIKTVSGFKKILGRNDGSETRTTRLKKADDSDTINLFIFSGEESKTSESDIANNEICLGLIYQGGEVIRLERCYPKDTEVEIQMAYKEERNSNKIADIAVLIDGQEVYSKPLGEDTP